MSETNEGKAAAWAADRLRTLVSEDEAAADLEWAIQRLETAATRWAAAMARTDEVAAGILRAMGEEDEEAARAELAAARAAIQRIVAEARDSAE